MIGQHVEQTQPLGLKVTSSVQQRTLVTGEVDFGAVCSTSAQLTVISEFQDLAQDL